MTPTPKKGLQRALVALLVLTATLLIFGFLRAQPDRLSNMVANPATNETTTLTTNQPGGTPPATTNVGSGSPANAGSGSATNSGTAAASTSTNTATGVAAPSTSEGAATPPAPAPSLGNNQTPGQATPEGQPEEGPNLPAPQDVNQPSEMTEGLPGEPAGPSSAVQNVTNEPNSGRGLLDGSPFHFGLAVGEMYDDNILISPHPEHSWLTHITPSIDFIKGDPDAPHQNYVNLHFAPTIFEYQDHSEDNRTDYDFDGKYQYTWTRLSMGIEQRYQHLTDASLDIGSLVNRDIYTTEANANYIYNDDLTLYGTATQQISVYPSTTINEWTVDSYGLYQVAPKLSLGVGPRFGFIDISGAPNENQQDLLFRLKYNPGGKINVGLDAGGEYLQYQGPTPNHVLPIFDLTINYAPVDGTYLSLGGGRETLNSYDLLGQTIVNTSVALSASQRIINQVYVSASLGYNKSDYEFGAESNNQTGTRRSDNYYFAKAGLEWDPKEWLKFNLSYQYSEQDSNFAQNSFTDNQFDFQTSVHF